MLAWRWTVREGTWRFSARYTLGTLLGLLAFVLAAFAFVSLINLAQDGNRTLPRDVTLLAPVQQAGSALTVEVANLAEKTVTADLCRVRVAGTPRTGGLGHRLDHGAAGRRRRSAGFSAGLLLAWAALRCPNGATFFLAVLAAFLLLQVVIPALRRLAQLPPPARSARRRRATERRRARGHRAIAGGPGLAELVRHRLRYRADGHFQISAHVRRRRLSPTP